MTKEQATREALELALEALETNNKAWKNLADSGDAGFWEAEEQPFYEIAVKAIIAIKKALAQPEQEPLAWLLEFVDEDCMPRRDVFYEPRHLQQHIKHNTEVRNLVCQVTPLYPSPPQRTEQEQQIETLKRCLFQMQEAAKDLVEQAKSLNPPQRTWVGLTEDEAFACKGRDYFETYKAIEAKLKEKNT